MEIISVVIRMIPIATAWILSFATLKALITLSAKRNKKKVLYISDYRTAHNRPVKSTSDYVTKKAV